MTDNSKKSKLELAIELLKVTLWPVIVLVIIVIFWKPLYLSINEVPNVINKSESITIGSLSLKIEKNTVGKPSEAVRNILQKISATGIDVLLSSNAQTEYFHQNEVLYGQKRYKELMELGMYEVMDSSHVGTDALGIKYYYAVMPTHTGIETRKYLIEILNGLLKEI
jgi:hypothetical protein